MLRVKSDKSDWLGIPNDYSVHAHKIRPSQRSRFLVLTKRSAASGDENEQWWQCSCVMSTTSNGSWQSWKTTAHASLAIQSAGKSRLKQQIPNVKSITERWRYFVDFLHGFESFYFPKRFIYLRGIAFSGPYRWNFRKARDFAYFIDPLLCIVASRAAFSRHRLLTSR